MSDNYQLSLSLKQRSKREEILKAATQLFFENGYGYTSMDRIQKEVGGSKRTLYELFPNKELLFKTIVEQAAIKVREGLSKPDNTEDIREVLIVMGMNFLKSITAVEGIMIYRTTVSEAASNPNMAAAFFKVGPKQTHEFLAGFLNANMKAGMLNISDSNLAAAQLLGAMRGELHLEAILYSKVPSSQKIKKHVTAAVDVFLSGCSVNR